MKNLYFSTIFFVLALFCISGADEVDRYDYIVLGSGSAGGVVAGRLSQDPSIRVLLIERGKDRLSDPTVAVANLNDVVPFTTNALGLKGPTPLELLPTEHFHTSEPFLFDSQAEPVCAFALGGGPAVSGSFWGRGDPTNYDEWATLTGDNRLTYANLLPFFKATENVANSDSSSSDRGRTGPINIVFHTLSDPAINPYTVTQSSSFGIPIGIDYATSAGTQGIFPMQRSLKREPLVCNATAGPCTRQSAYHTYIAPFLNQRRNLDVVTEATALKLVTRRSGGRTRVVGVDYLKDGEVVRAKAKEETIVSLGAFGSPKFLQLSGIGPQPLLNSLNIDVVRNLTGVGKNLQDHFFTFFVFLNPLGTPVTSPSSVGISFLKSGFNGNNIDMEIAYTALPTSFFNLPPGTPGHLLLVVPVQVRNNSIGGTLSARSKNPTEKPDVVFNYSPLLLNPFVWAVKKIRSWMNATSPAILELFPGPKPLADGGIPAGATDDEIRAYLANNADSYHHMHGTCKMGPGSDPLAVVDTEFKVHGVDGLRVVDLSVAPTLTSSHPHATASMLGELASSYILDTYYS